MTDTVKVLQRLKRRFGRERAREDRLAEAFYSAGQQRNGELCHREADTWMAAMALLDAEIRKAKR
jgi:hypothetical protein